ncbi:MAG: carbohydrate kinase family protein [Clostridia bacterium]|nr:carbohydrate kinase family protein [Clostridia bacterium]
MRIIVIGGMNLDLMGVPEGTLLFRDSNPGKIMLRPGGVGRNIASRLKTLGAQVSLLTALGNDDRTDMLTGFCLGEGIDLSLSVKTNCPCPTYLCIHDEKGDMAAAVSDMIALDCLTPTVMEARIDQINAFDACVIDANLSAATLQYIGQHVGIPLIADPVSTVKAQRLRGILPLLTAIKPNQLEAAALTGENHPDAAAQTLRAMGVKNVFISMGAEGVYFSGPGEKGAMPAQKLPTVPLTGAGDALCAGLTLALAAGKSPRECARMGCQAAHDALMVAGR